MGKWIHFRAQCGQNYWLYQNIVQIKLVENWILYKKVSGRICLSLPGVEQAVSKDWYVSNIMLYQNGKVDSLQDSTLPKIHIITKSCSNNSCSGLNFVQKSQWMHMSISPRSGARGPERLICYKYYIAQK